MEYPYIDFKAERLHLKSFFKLVVLLICLLTGLTGTAKAQSPPEQPGLSFFQRYEIPVKPFEIRMYDVDGDTIAFLSLSHYQLYLHASDFTFYIINVKTQEFEKHNVAIPEEFRNFVLNEKGMLRDIAFRNNTLFLTFITSVLEISYNNNDNKYIATDWYKLPAHCFCFNIYVVNNNDIICSRLFDSSDPQIGDAEILIYDRHRKKQKYHKRFTEITGSQLNRISTSQWIIHTDKHTVLASPGHYKLKLFANKNMDKTHEVILDSIIKPLYLQDSSFYKKDDSQKEYIKRKTGNIDSINMIRKMVFLNDTTFIVVRTDKKFGEHKQAIIDLWEIKDNKLLLSKSDIMVNSSKSKSSDRLKEKIITPHNLPIPSITGSPPFISHGSYLVSVTMFSKNSKNTTDLMEKATYQDYRRDSDQRSLSDDLFLELRFYNLLQD